jgi:hypothetical protein
MSRNVSLLVRSLTSAFVLLCTLEALYWPILMKLGIQLHWWQVHWLAKLGFYIGFIPCGIALFTGSKILSLASAFVFALFVFWLLGLVFRPFLKAPANACGHATQVA